MVEALLKGPYQTVLGPIAFDAGHERADNPYRLMQWQAGRFVPVADAAGAQ
ncbi:hypothetical protein D3C87_1908100 [compost metagenome]